MYVHDYLKEDQGFFQAKNTCFKSGEDVMTKLWEMLPVIYSQDFRKEKYIILSFTYQEFTNTETIFRKILKNKDVVKT